MPARKSRFMSITCDIAEVDAKLEEYGVKHDLLAMTAYQVGIGFGAKVNVIMAFRLREWK